MDISPAPGALCPRATVLSQKMHLWRPTPACNTYLGHSLRLNADVADTVSQNSLRKFGKYCWPNLNYGKIYIFISNTFLMLKFTFFFAKKLENALSRP